jgi:hypothetical protein
MSLLRRVLPAVVASSVATAVAVVGLGSSAASADDPFPHQPIGWVEHATAPTAATLHITGWTADPDAPTTNLVASGLVDGHVAVQATTSVARPDVAKTYHVGPTAGFVLDVPVPSGNHTVCVVAGNVGDGVSRVVKCFYTPLGRTVSESERVTHNAYGAITWANAGTGYYHVMGWAADPDFYRARLTLGLYLDGTEVANANTMHVADWTPPDGVGPNARFDVTLRVAAGAHLLCVRLGDVGPGDNSWLSCRASDTRGRGTGTVTPPAVNGKVVTEAKTHIGQRYVWGAAGPTTFDCSGLVIYSYGKFGVSTPRVSEDQFRAARVISADRAVPGDLVFYHDATGDVYHVGIYLSPGHTVAAIDTAHGVDYQPIWDPDSATYGSFTHS